MKKRTILLALTLIVSSCSGVNTLLKKKNLDVQTKMSHTIFLNPVAPDKKIIYLNIRNTSDKKLNIVSKIKNILIAKKYIITNNPEQANFILQTNILSVAKTDLQQANSALAGAVKGGVTGGVLSSGSDSNSKKNAVLFGAAVGFLSNAIVKDTVYTMVTDVQIREKSATSELINQHQKSNISQGSTSTIIQKITNNKVNWKIYSSRIVSIANQSNLDFITAKEKLEQGLIHVIAGTF